MKCSEMKTSDLYERTIKSLDCEKYLGYCDFYRDDERTYERIFPKLIKAVDLYNVSTEFYDCGINIPLDDLIVVEDGCAQPRYVKNLRDEIREFCKEIFRKLGTKTFGQPMSYAFFGRKFSIERKGDVLCLINLSAPFRYSVNYYVLDDLRNDKNKIKHILYEIFYESLWMYKKNVEYEEEYECYDIMEDAIVDILEYVNFNNNPNVNI
jgi:hypothetical protein